MPLYEMKCMNEECKFEYEDQLKLAEADDAKCPACGSPAVRENRTNPGFYRHSSATTWRMGHGS